MVSCTSMARCWASNPTCPRTSSPSILPTSETGGMGRVVFEGQTGRQVAAGGGTVDGCVASPGGDPPCGVPSPRHAFGSMVHVSGKSELV
jgi:hypothetical protein